MASASRWQGNYLGLQLGYGRAGSRFVDDGYNGLPPFPTVVWNVPSDGAMLGLQGGRQWQRDRLVYGWEGELGRLNLNGHRFPPGVDPVLGDPYDAAGLVRRGWFASLSARIGYAPDRTQFYGKAGLVYANARLGFIDTCVTGWCGPATTVAGSKVGWGYQLGLGVEHALSPRWTVKAEYSFMDFGRRSLQGVFVGGGAAGTPYRVRASLSVHTLKLGVNYRF